MSSPTQRSLKLMRERGFHAEVVERWIPGANIRRDLFHVADILCFCVGRPITLVQATSASNISARVNKIAEADLIGDLRAAGFHIWVHGWRKVKGRWQVREVDCS